MRHKGKRAIARVIGVLLKLGGVLAIIAGLMTIALANMDMDPRESIIEGTLTTCVGLLMVYFGSKIAKRAKRM
jgi:ascorbate-specific PTS system EIIC-type component UlaA